MHLKSLLKIDETDYDIQQQIKRSHAELKRGFMFLNLKLPFLMRIIWANNRPTDKSSF